MLRKITGIKKIGHAGTLDPFASGLLICAIGREATREINQFVKLDKEYIAEIFLGATSDTYDRTGIINNYESRVLGITNYELNEVKKVIEKFIGSQKQIPPMYSAKKVGGRKLYELARKGLEIERQPNDINIFDIKILGHSFPLLTLKINCSSGTYIRSLAHDIGQALGCGAYLKNLKRTKIGEFNLSKAVDIKRLNENNWRQFLFFISTDVY
jgi:tRNA pseudouridine55 synthase